MHISMQYYHSREKNTLKQSSISLPFPASLFPFPKTSIIFFSKRPEPSPILFFILTFALHFGTGIFGHGEFRLELDLGPPKSLTEQVHLGTDTRPTCFHP
eukprot:TRINITY_DN35981_c0_g1_i1.p1 TRINITY_DN35981_c0_g1~~TRINITY_DN35981_c0_g1_i1.p1  ORF type:complete len:100 (+),score=10.01 TRINITY_DN35981_c0_g1_i1:184-483(+)